MRRRTARTSFKGRLATALLFAVLGSGAALAHSATLSAADCERLRALTIAADEIGLPTSGAIVTRTQMIDAEGGAHPPHCLVWGEIGPIDLNAPSIEFQIALPRDWNSNGLMLGGGGFNGVIPPLRGPLVNAPPSALTPLARGYAVFGSDSGHQVQTPASSTSVRNQDSAFLGNEESFRNYRGDALKKTHDVARAIIRAAYGRAPRRMYFFGASKGGGEALIVVHRWPQDWDGVVALYPAREPTLNMLGFLISAQTLAEPGAFLSLADRRLLYQGALAACDHLDGVRDGLISNERGCRARFDPTTAQLNGAPIRCADGADAGDACLSDRQIAALLQLEGATPLDFLPGRRSFPGFNILTSDLGGSGDAIVSPPLTLLSIGETAPRFPTAEGNALSVYFSDNFFRFAIANDSAFNHLSLDIADPGDLSERLRALYAMDQTSMDLSAFAARGGKLIIVHGTQDMLVSPRMTEAYYQGLQAAMGARNVERFLRFYEIPGFSHARSTVFDARWDGLTALEGWVERGQDPARNQIVIDVSGVPGRTRPLCHYPAWPRYRGSGDINRASSFVCSER